MPTLLQTLLLETLPDTDAILRSFIETVLPAMEREFALSSALGGSEEAHCKAFRDRGHPEPRKAAQKFAKKADQSLLVHVLNALLTAWNLTEHLPGKLSEIEKRLLCLGFCLHDYDKFLHSQGKNPPESHQVSEILKICQELGERLNFQEFWGEWLNYLPEIGYLAQNTQYKQGSNTPSSNWPNFTIEKPLRLRSPLCHLLAFGDIAVHLNEPADIVAKSGDRLREHLRFLNIRKKLVYHRLRDCRGLLTNGIHNAVVQFAGELEWQPILYLAAGAIYLAPVESQTPDLAEVQEFIWEQISTLLGEKMLGGDIGFKRDGKGLKIASLTLELFSPSELIRNLTQVMEVRVGNEKNPATPKRLEKLPLSESEREFLATGADIRSDRLAEFLILTQREFFEGCEAFAPWVLEKLGLRDRIQVEQTQVQSGGVNYGWYQAAARYIADRPSLKPEELSVWLSEFSESLATWAEANNLLPTHANLTREVFSNYLEQYLEISGWGNQTSPFQSELYAYTAAKANNQPICSLSSGEFLAEEQRDSVVLFKPQQYSNKNALGGNRLQRGISKIWSLEMLLRQALWRAPAGKLEEQQPVFLYIFPAYVYTPQTAKAVRVLVDEMKWLNLWDVCQQWLAAGMNYRGLQNLPWREDEETEEGRFARKYSTRDLPFMATSYTTTRGKSVTEAWVYPAFLALALPMLLGVKVVATSSPEPLYTSDKEFPDSVILDGAAGFWNLLGLSTSLRVQELPDALERLLVAYSLHLQSRSKPGDARWQAFNGTVRELVTDVLNVFTLANEGLRRDKRDRPTSQEAEEVWKYAQILAKGDKRMSESLSLIEKLVEEYRKFYRVSGGESSHAILLPIAIALDNILSIPKNINVNDVILEGAGQIQKALERREVYRPILMDKPTNLDYSTRLAQEFEAIQAFMTTCVQQLFLGDYKGDRALLQENRNRIKAGAEFAYRRLALQEKLSQAKSQGEKK